MATRVILTAERFRQKWCTDWNLDPSTPLSVEQGIKYAPPLVFGWTGLQPDEDYITGLSGSSTPYNWDDASIITSPDYVMLQLHVDMYTAFTEIVGRNPQANETIIFEVEENFAPYPLVFRNNFPTSCKLFLENKGYVIGCGGDGGVYPEGGESVPNYSNGKKGSTALRVASGLTLYVTNYSVIAGGGGGSPAVYYGGAWYKAYCGSGGASSGSGYGFTPGDMNNGIDAWPDTFKGNLITGGGSIATPRHARGGGMGEAGKMPTIVDSNVILIGTPGKAGCAYRGDVYINNVGLNAKVLGDTACGAVRPWGDQITTPVQRTKTLATTLTVSGQAVASASRNFNYLESVSNTTELTVDPTYPGNHINLWGYFIWKNGRTPNPDESITFVIPESRVYVAPNGFTSALATENGPQYQSNQFLRKFQYSHESVFTGDAAVSLKGWDAGLNNKIVVEVRGKVLGSVTVSQSSGVLGASATPLFTLYNKADPTKMLTYMELYNTGLFSDPMAHLRAVREIAKNNPIIEDYQNDTGWGAYIALSEPVKNPAFYTEVPFTLRIASGGYVLGGGGKAAFQMYQKDRIWYDGYLNPYKQEETSDRKNIHGGDAMWIGGNNTKVIVENYGYFSGGGGGGASIGSWNEGVLNQNFTFAAGGGAAPYGNISIGLKFPLYVDLVALSQIPMKPKPANWIDWDFSFELDQNGNTAEYNHLVYLYKSDLENIFDWSRIGFDQYKDTILDVSVFNASGNINNIVSPVAGYQSTLAGPNGMNLISGGGGAPGMNGQIGTIVHDGGSGTRLNQIGNFAGSKGAAVVYKGTNNSVVVNNYPGSVYNV